MRLPACCDGLLEWAYPGSDTVPHLRRVDAPRMLCGRELNAAREEGWVPTLQPVDPGRPCEQCAVLLDTLLGWCRVCGAELVADEHGVAGAHGGCVGVNLPLRRSA